MPPSPFPSFSPLHFSAAQGRCTTSFILGSVCVGFIIIYLFPSFSAIVYPGKHAELQHSTSRIAHTCTTEGRRLSTSTLFLVLMCVFM
ncbi:hypothetical protein ABB37_08580 [Leptomonas pyrrhocoris]|uniref:Uncharacterized protein n=1 Tax=Leptomonas pyrrhocoris TaxID=157538 RepID=A0A0M9FSX2_LEPPY|nr:hypothetical protein ABB37_08580 [Leptomonas pyrrhocoris]KPA75279.1 hypothetical protein ABB37_08580 [Leptomonas pyrrhocoris]|eukprot:XP_015653718.1 hypothetical protein ABB37_08580 [Leptomonas pyrrhocoris]